MANKIVNAVKKIKLGNANAKSVLRELADCANKDGFCFPSYATIAEVLEVSSKSIQRGMEFLVHNGWVIRSEKPKINGKFVGFNFQINLNLLGLSDDDFLPEEPLDNLTDGQSDQWTICPPESDSPMDNLSENYEKPVDNLTNGQSVHQNPNKEDLSLNPQFKGINQERECASTPHPPEQFQSSVRNISIEESNQNFTPRTDALAHSPPVQLFEEKFKITLGNAFAEQLAETIQTEDEMDLWTILLTEKIAYADESEAKRKGMQRWILTAYNEKLEKKNASNNNQKSAIERREEDKFRELSAIEQVRQRVAEKRKSRLSG